uniref:Uncharacterized protein n=1 Tax=Caulerpa cliftonii TaxID=1004391 RepID=A0A1C9JBU2_9CHLO|nr:hypothetical protein [Caulerpa cliftonii]AOP19312.1 hypothetical protein [Caulerpa cliftonii]
MNNFDKILKSGIQSKLLSIDGENIIYEIQKKIYKFTDPEEIVRAVTYINLVNKYKYSPYLIDFEVCIPRRTSLDRADIVVYRDEKKTINYLVVENKKTNIGDVEFNQAIEQGFGNANSLRANYLLVSNLDNIKCYDILKFAPNQRIEIPDIPINYGLVPEYKYIKNENSLEIVSFETLSKIFQKCHNIIWSGGKFDPSSAFDEMSKIIFAKIQDEKNTRNNNEYKFQIGLYENEVIVSQRILELYRDAQKIDKTVFDEDIYVTYSKIFQVVRLLQNISLSETDIDAKGQAFEKFLGVIFRGELGQFFTRRQIVEFAVDFLEPTDRDYILDPSCGSGGFLLYSLKKVVKQIQQDFFGNDQFHFIARKIYDFCHQNIYGIEINDKISRLAKIDMILNGDGHANIENNTGLNNKYQNPNIHYGKFSLILSNPPFGVKIKKGNQDDLGTNDLDNFELSSRKIVNSDILFLEQYCKFLTNETTKNPRLGVILQTGIINNPSNKKLLKWLKCHFKILGIINLPIFAFRKAGSSMKTILLFLSKYSEPYKSIKEIPNYELFFSIAEHIGYDSALRDDFNEFPEILKNYKNKTNSDNCFWYEFNKLEYRIDPLYYLNKKFILKQIKKLQKNNIKMVKLSDILVDGEISGKSPCGGITRSSGEIPSITVNNITKEGNISFDEGRASRFVSEGFYKNFQATKAKLQIGDILIVKDGATIGKTAVITDTYLESVFSEHIFRLRVLTHISPLYIHAILNSELGQFQIKNLITGGAQGGITKDFSKNIYIPLIKNQEKIARYWQENIADIEQFKKQYNQKVEKFKNSIIEKIIVAAAEEGGG